MARMGKAKPVKAKRLKVRVVKAARTDKSIIVNNNPTLRNKTLKVLAKKQEAAAAAAPVAKADVAKKVSQKLLETIEKRRKEQGKAPMFSRPPGRRGRRPKGAVEYTPENQEEEVLVSESDNEGLEYDTGIRVKQTKDDAGFSMDRFEDFDEELNFDW